MSVYFDENESIANSAAGRTEAILAAVASRFIGAHPKRPPVYRTHAKNGFRRGEDYRYDMNLTEKWPGLLDGQFIYVWGKLWCDQETESLFSVSCYSPVTIFVNRNVQFESNLNDDVFPDRKAYFRVKLNKGWNDIVLEFVKTGTGCGGKFGTGSVKGAPMHFLSPTPQRAGQEGWIYSEPQDGRWTVLPGEDGDFARQSRWFPDLHWTPKQLADGCFSRIFGSVPEKLAFAWTKLDSSSPAAETIVLKGDFRGGPCTVYVDGKTVHRTEGSEGALEIPVRASFGQHDVVIQSMCAGKEWGFTLEVVQESGAVKLVKPYPVQGLTDCWLYLGPFAADGAPEASGIARVDSPFGQGGETTFWRADRPDTWVRPYLESSMFGKWNYPLGVTLYGILQTGLELEDRHYTDYAADHIEQCTSLNEYSLWDREQYGAPGTNHQLACIDSLDDCGSFGAAMLEAHKVRKLRGAEAAAERIASYITRVQDRLPDGALYRVRGTTDFMKDTMWCDDLYMSTPFLSKYYELTGDESYLDDAAAQFLSYKIRLYMPERQIMHHVYDYKHDKPNGVAWGRGNGWVLFSLTELLAVMPEGHKMRPPVLDFYRELCAGYLKLQGGSGLWHQVLTDPESYDEASCTSMFIYAFARGVRFGWLPEPEPYVRAALRGWDALTRHCIDKNGNVYGVCRGSGYSFSRLYYKDQLTWQLNDTHGIGIVLLAGIETVKLRKHASEGGA